MDFYALLDQTVEVLRTRGRVSYRALKHQFDLDDELLETLREELIFAYRGAIREEGPGLVWTAEVTLTPTSGAGARTAVSREASEIAAVQRDSLRVASHEQVAERRQLTAMFCDLVDSTRLARLKEGPERRAALLAEAGVDAINLHHSDWTGGLTTLFHRFRRYAFGWDAQHERVLQTLLRMGIDGVYSDWVDRMTDAFREEIL